MRQILQQLEHFSVTKQVRCSILLQHLLTPHRTILLHVNTLKAWTALLCLLSHEPTQSSKFRSEKKNPSQKEFLPKKTSVREVKSKYIDNREIYHRLHSCCGSFYVKVKHMMMTSLSLSQSKTVFATAMALSDSPNQQYDWRVCINDHTNTTHVQLSPLTFVHLFIIHRLLVKHKITVEEFTRHIKDKTLQHTSVALCSELTSGGMKEYMKTHNDNASSSNLIEQMFDIAVNKFSQQYAQVTTYNYKQIKHSGSDSSNSNINDSPRINIIDSIGLKNSTTGSIDNIELNSKTMHMSFENDHWQKILFNTTDLMHLIFQFLEYNATWYDNHFDGDLFSCSLVCSYWLYHALNPKAIYHITISGKSLQFELNKDNYEMNIIKYKRAWMRFVNVRSVYMSFSDKTSKHYTPHSLFLQILSLWGNVTIIGGHCYPEQMPIVQVLISNCKEKLQKYQLEILSSKMDVLAPLKLTNAKYIYIYSWYFDIIWSKMCKILMLSQVSVDREWCNMVIDKCDCNGVRSIELSDVFFDLSDIFNKNQRLKFLYQFAQKFINLVHLKMILYKTCEQDVLIFWRMLTDIVEKNKGTVELTVQLEGNTNYEILNRAMKLNINQKSSNNGNTINNNNNNNYNNTNINTLVIYCDQHWQWNLDKYDCLKSMITNKNLKHLYIKTWGDAKCKGLLNSINLMKKSYVKQSLRMRSSMNNILDVTNVSSFDSLRYIQIESLYNTWNANDAINVIIDLLNLEIINNGQIFLQLNADS